MTVKKPEPVETPAAETPITVERIRELKAALDAGATIEQSAVEAAVLAALPASYFELPEFLDEPAGGWCGKCGCQGVELELFVSGPACSRRRKAAIAVAALLPVLGAAAAAGVLAVKHCRK